MSIGAETVQKFFICFQVVVVVWGLGGSKVVVSVLKVGLVGFVSGKET